MIGSRALGGDVVALGLSVLQAGPHLREQVQNQSAHGTAGPSCTASHQACPGGFSFGLDNTGGL
jgi:hypothetical protein